MPSTESGIPGPEDFYVLQAHNALVFLLTYALIFIVKCAFQTKLNFKLGSFLLCLTLLSVSYSANANSKLNKPHHKISKKSKSLHPVELIVEKLVSEIETRSSIRDPELETQEVSVIEADATKASWLQKVYAAHLVEASKLTAMLSDKLLQNRIFEHYLLDRSDHFLLHSIGLKEFLLKYHLVDSEKQLIPNTDNFEEALAEEFPNGFMVRPALGVAPLERNHGLFATNDDFLKEIFRPHNSLYQPNTLFRPIKSHIINAVASGEAIILQEDFVRSFQSKQRLKFKSYERLRLHSFENKVVANANPELWFVKRNFEVSAADIKKTEVFVQSFLDLLPKNLTAKQAWGIDVALLDNGELKIIDIITNRGLKSFWSSYLDEPKILGAYSRHLEEYANVNFQGFNGILFRSNLANYFNYWKLKRARSAEFPKQMSFSAQIFGALPPWPF